MTACWPRLDPTAITAADRYLEIRRKLVRLFEWRGCSTPDEYADETINRCAKKIGEGEEIRDLATYSIGVARMLVREMGRERAKEARPLDEAPEPRSLPLEPEGDAGSRVECLTALPGPALARKSRSHPQLLPGRKGEKIKNRKGLTQMFGIPSNTLRMRALRVRERLQLCAENCLQRAGRGLCCDKFRNSASLI